MDIKEVNTSIEKLEKSRTDLLSFIGAEVAKHPSLKKAFEDLELVNGSLLKCREERNKLEKAAAEEEEKALAEQEAKKAAEEAAAAEAEAAKAKEKEDAAKADIEKAISEEKEISDQFVEEIAKAHSLTTDKVEDIIAGVLEAQADQD